MDENHAAPLPPGTVSSAVDSRSRTVDISFTSFCWRQILHTGFANHLNSIEKSMANRDLMTSADKRRHGRALPARRAGRARQR